MDVRERIKEFVIDFEKIYVKEFVEVLWKDKEFDSDTKYTLCDKIRSEIFYDNFLEKYMVDKKLLSFLENNSNLKGKSLTRFLWFYFKKKLNQDLVEVFLKGLGGTYWTIPKISEKEITETNNNLIKLCEKEILNNEKLGKQREISH